MRTLARADPNKSLVVVESQCGHYVVWVISVVVVGIVNATSSNEHCSVIANPLESNQLALTLRKNRLNCAYLLALWYDIVSPFRPIPVTVLKCTPSFVNRNELVLETITFNFTETVQWIEPV